ncbi:MAG: hypothetical protein U1E08_09710 [Coriobacteriia bacterium]|nr:hypothetical protein [Actinomycetota bacterium]MDZ4167952.1 hypothetical protein [Coriobacteriia bacterium]
MPLSKTARTALVALIPLAAVACAVAILSIPPDARLGTMVRFVMFHGASTWVNMATFTLAGLAGLGYIAGVRRLLPWGQALRWFSLPLWTLNTVLGILSMQLIWGGILWKEPRLLMTFGLLAGSVVIVAIQLIADSPKAPAVLDALLAGGLWYLVLALPNLFHPDSPVFSSENSAYIVGFLGMVASIAVVAFATVMLIARRAHSEKPAAE